MNILYKVVRYSNRISLYAAGRYQRRYELEEIVTALPYTLGLMCFDNNINAEVYRESLDCNAVTIKVEALSEVRKPAGVFKLPQDVSESNLDHFYSSQEAARVDAPKGTVLCHKIRVLE